VKSSALVFFAAFLALAGSWGGFVLAPQIQLGRAVQVKETGSENLYPLVRPGLATRGAEVYRANGCVYCHSQQIGQDGVHCEVILTDAGTNSAATAAGIARVNSKLTTDQIAKIFQSLPQTITTVADMNAADAPVAALQSGGGKTEVRIVPTGRDIALGWGRRRTVAQDYLQDPAVQLGSRRVGPDLANVGTRITVDAALRHLYAPQGEVKGSTMPAYRFLFEKRRIGRTPSPDALQLAPEFAPGAGFEIVPREEARQLAAYLVSLRAEAPLFEAPVTVAQAAVATNTNSPAK